MLIGGEVGGGTVGVEDVVGTVEVDRGGVVDNGLGEISGLEGSVSEGFELGGWWGRGWWG